MPKVTAEKLRAVRNEVLERLAALPPNPLRQPDAAAAHP